MIDKPKRVFFFKEKNEVADAEHDQNERVISAKRVLGGIELREECDQYFRVILTKDELEAFIHQLRMIVDQPAPAAEDDNGA